MTSGNSSPLPMLQAVLCQSGRCTPGATLMPLCAQPTVACSYVLPEACFSPRFFCVAVLGLIALCIGRLVHALAAFSVPVDVTHSVHNQEPGLLRSCLRTLRGELVCTFVPPRHAYTICTHLHDSSFTECAPRHDRRGKQHR